MREYYSRYRVWIKICSILLSSFAFILPSVGFAAIATSSVFVSVCGDGAVDSYEVCDDGVAGNDGGYSTSIAARRCNATCDGYGPYCGDLILHPFYGEACDDGNNTNGDLCSNICLNESPPIIATTSDTGGGYSGGGGGGSFTGNVPFSNPTRVALIGRAYPNTTVNVLKDGELIGTAASDSDANFRFEEANASPGPTTYGFWAEDINGTRSIIYTTTFQVTQNAMTTVSGILLPPTIDISETVVSPGDSLTVLGQTVPNALVTTHFLSGSTTEEVMEESPSDDSGVWGLSYDTSSLTAERFYTAKSQYEAEIDAQVFESGFSQSISFYLGEGGADGGIFPDLNRDGSVNIVDFSILLFHWNTDGGDSDPPADINHDGTVNITDFSIMIFYWTG